MSNAHIMVSLPAEFHPAPVDMAAFRAERFEKVLKAYMLAKGNVWQDGTGQSWLADMLADALHWADVNGVNASFVLKMAQSHFESEKLEDVRQKMVRPSHQPATPHH